jgi:uncharacterized membrane protein YhaH (DUF805 family)
MRWLVVGVCAAALGAAAALSYDAMREQMISTGAFCANGGPYVIAQECDPGSVARLAGGMIGAIVALLALVGATSWAGGSPWAAGLLGFGGLFAVLGFNFVDLGLDPPGPETSSAGWLISGAAFWLMALCALVPGVALVVGRLRRRGEPEPPLFSTSGIVMARRVTQERD